MRTSVDVPDEVYRAVKVMAAERGTTVRELVLEGLHTVIRTKPGGRKGPESQEAEPTASQVGPETNDELIGFP
jgi:hypothetical protein